MALASPPSIGRVYRSPSSSKRIVLPSGEMSSETHVPSSVVNSTVRSGLSGRPLGFLPGLVLLLLGLGLLLALFLGGAGDRPICGMHRGRQARESDDENKAGGTGKARKRCHGRSVSSMSRRRRVVQGESSPLSSIIPAVKQGTARFHRVHRSRRRRTRGRRRRQSAAGRGPGTGTSVRDGRGPAA